MYLRRSLWLVLNTVGDTEGCPVVFLVVRTVGLRVGFKEGDRVGPALLGFMLGLVLGRRLGGFEDRTVGEWLDAGDGWMVGARLGRTVGRSDGLTVGLYVLVGPLLLGWLVGCGEIDGAALGLLLGWPEGLHEGGDTGRLVGATLGGTVGYPSAVLNMYSVAFISSLLMTKGSIVPLKSTLSPANMSSSLLINPFGSFEK